MTDYISREAAIGEFETCGSVFVYGKKVCKAIISRLNVIPAADVVEVVRCGDCRYKDDGIDEDGYPFLKCLHGRSYGGTRINDYCSWGKPREDGDGE